MMSRSDEQVKPAILVMWRHICPKASSRRLLMEMFVRAYKFFANSFFTTMPRGAKNLGINIVQRCFNPSGWRMSRIRNWFSFSICDKWW